MIGRLAGAALLLAASGAVAATVSAAEHRADVAGVRPSDEAQPDRRILVMLRLPAEHYRPASDYGAVGGYGDAAAAAARRRLAQRLARENGLELIDNWPMPLLGIDCVVMAIPDGRAPDDVAARMSDLASVEWSQPMNRFETQGAASPPNDRLFAAQPAAKAWHLAALHRMATGKGVKVAVIDSQVDGAHPDLRGQLIDNRNFVGGAVPAAEAHGTGVAGIIGARADNWVGIAGIAPGAELMGLRACWQKPGAAGTICDTLSLARALAYAVEHRAGVINLSLSGPRDLLLTRLVQAGLQRGAAIVAAADPRIREGFPASIPGVIAVSAEGFAAVRPGVYNAPGRDVPTTEPGGRWYLVSGNSYAAAHVSGLIALMRQSDRRPPRLLVSPESDHIDACRSLARAARHAESACEGPD